MAVGTALGLGWVVGDAEDVWNPAALAGLPARDYPPSYSSCQVIA